MAFIKNSVGQGGKNSPQDVKIIQWMLQSTQWFYGRRVFTDQYGIKENGVLETETLKAIRDVMNCPKPFQPKRYKSWEYPILSKFIAPDDLNYVFLLLCCIKPLCVTSGEKEIAFAENSVTNQALQDKINFITFRKIAEDIAKEKVCRTLTAAGHKARELLKKPEIRAFLDMLAVVEGTDLNNDGKQSGYNVRMGGTPTKPIIEQDLSKHSGNVALGRYQAIPGTWLQDAKILGLTDFTPESQDIFGAGKLIAREMADDIVNNRFAEAIDKGSPEWASLPNAAKTAANGGNPTSYHVYSRGANKGKPQPSHSLEDLRQIYDTALGR
jgi:muramidase (phage lysozyme)